MSHETVVENLGTIARSGTKAFLEALKSANAAQRPDLIGQFGVGFYSAFMVADKVAVVKQDGRAAWRSAGESDGQGGVHGRGRPIAARVLDVILHLKADAKDFLRESFKLRGIIKRSTLISSSSRSSSMSRKTDPRRKRVDRRGDAE